VTIAMKTTMRCSRIDMLLGARSVTLAHSVAVSRHIDDPSGGARLVEGMEDG
jgi:hypothetical protein